MSDIIRTALLVLIILFPLAYVFFSILRDMAEADRQYANSVNEAYKATVVVMEDLYRSLQPTHTSVQVLDTFGPVEDDFGRIRQSARISEDDPGWVVVKGEMPKVGEWVTLVVDPTSFSGPYIDSRGNVSQD